jgi:nicotinate-nucleotide adenylyltransferase
MDADGAGGVASPRRIGLFGGSFDPVHQAHRQLADVALEQLLLDELRWIPVGHPWQKARRLAPAEHRAAMVALAIGDNARFAIERCELERAGPSYTLDTVRLLQQRETRPAVWYLILGQDQLANFSTWHGWRELAARVVLAVAGRAEQAVQPPETLAREPQVRVVPLMMPPQAVSSTELRHRLAAGEPARSLAPGMVAPAVADYIARHGLYRPDPPPTGHCAGT